MMMTKAMLMRWIDLFSHVVQKLKLTFINTGQESSNLPLQALSKIYLIQRQKQRKLTQGNTKLVQVCSKKN